MDIQILLWFQNLRSPILNALNDFITLFAEEAVLLVLLCVIYWCLNKKSAQFIIFNFMAAVSVNNVLKVAFCVPRPWLRDARVQPYEKALDTATGFSFPSGHAACATSVYGSFALLSWGKRRWLSGLLTALTLLVCVARMYAGVHTLQDVVVSLVLGVIFIFMVRAGLRGLERHPERDTWVLVGSLVLAVAMLLYTYFKPYPADVDRELLQDTYKTAGALGGLGIAWFAERRWVKFDEKAPLWFQIVKLVVGIAGILALRALLKPVCVAVFGAEFAGAVRYFAIILWAIWLWPLAFKKIQARLG